MRAEPLKSEYDNDDDDDVDGDSMMILILFNSSAPRGLRSLLARAQVVYGRAALLAWLLVDLLLVQLLLLFLLL